MKYFQWNHHSVGVLLSAYNKGMHMKQIGLLFDVSQNAILKSVKRYTSKPIKILCKKQRKPEPYKVHIDQTWVKIEKVYQWINSQGFNITQINSKYFSVNGIRYTKERLLLLVNKARLSKGLNIFKVEGITQN